MYDDTIRTIYCNCSEFGRLHSCCHIPAAIMNSDVFEEMERDSKSISKIILNTFSNEKSIIKKKLKVLYYLIIDNYYSYNNLSLKLKIGYDKLYTVGKKLMVAK